MARTPHPGYQRIHLDQPSRFYDLLPSEEIRLK